MAITKTLWRVAAHKHARPDQTLADLNKELCRDNETVMFVTVFYGILHLRTGEIEYSNGGHNLPFFLSGNGRVQLLENTGGMALGVMEEVTFRAKTIVLQAGEGLFLYTDGVTEAMDRAGNLFTEPRLQECLQQANGAAPAEVIRNALEAVKQFATGAEQSDDITTLAIRYLRH
jgi:sigma-B regulation protein RsbU (phosphoserine phosphatase)